jgi:hypothetical protein
MDKHLPFVFTYLDNHIIASRTLEEHRHHIRQFFTIRKTACRSTLQSVCLQLQQLCSSPCQPARCLPSTATHPGHHCFSLPSGCETIATVFRYGEFLHCQRWYAQFSIGFRQMVCTVATWYWFLALLWFYKTRSFLSLEHYNRVPHCPKFFLFILTIIFSQYSGTY